MRKRLPPPPGRMRRFGICAPILATTQSAPSLSFPMTVEGGYLCNWRERIILIDQNGPVCDVRGRDDDDYGPDFDIPVRRKR